MGGGDLHPGRIVVLDKLTSGTVRYVRLGGAGVTVAHEPLHEFPRRRAGLVAALIEHFAKLAGAHRSLGRGGRHG